MGTMTSKVEQFGDYTTYEFYEYGQTVGYVVVTRYGWNAFRIIHIELNKNFVVAALKFLVGEYTKKGKALSGSQITD